MRREGHFSEYNGTKSIDNQDISVGVKQSFNNYQSEQHWFEPNMVKPQDASYHFSQAKPFFPQ